jgi:hypothetical protein
MTPTSPPKCEACFSAAGEFGGGYSKHHALLAQKDAALAEAAKRLERRTRSHSMGQTYKWDEEDKAFLARLAAKEGGRD